MRHYIGTLTACEAYNAKIKKAKGYKGKATSRWTTIRRHPSKSLFAIRVNEAIEPDEESGLTLVEELTEDWNPTEEE